MRISRRAVFVLGVLVSCGPGQPAVTEPPKIIHGGWVREAMDVKTAADVPESLKTLKPTTVWHVTYKGPQDISGLWILYPGETVAFEAMQKMNKSAAVWPFHRGAFFVALDTAGLPPQALGDFQEGVSKVLP